VSFEGSVAAASVEIIASDVVAAAVRAVSPQVVLEGSVDIIVATDITELNIIV
jgi:hypothetical protein